MRYLRTNTAARITVGPFFDKTDGITPETALTVTSCKLTFMVDDGNVPTLVLDTNPTASGGANDMVHVTNDDAGFYDLELAAANVNYLGRAMLAITDAATHCPVFHEFMILPAMIYDAMILGTDVMQVDMTQILGTAVSTPTVAGVPNVNVKTWNDLTTVALPLVPATAGRSLVVDAAGLADANVVKVGPTGSGTAQTAGDIIGDTNDIQARLPAALTANGNMKSSLMEIIATALTETSGQLAGGFKKWFDVAAPTGTVNSLPNAIPTAANGLYTRGSGIGQIAQNGPNGSIDVNVRYIEGTSQTAGNIVALVNTVDDFLDTEIADIQARLPAALTAGGNMKADALAISGDTIAADNLEAAADGTTYNLGGGAIVAASVTGAVGSVTGLTASNLDATISSRATPAQVNTEVLDVLTVDTFAQPGQEAPAATTTISKMLAYLYKAWRNKTTQTATTYSLFNDDAATVDHKATTSDDATTFTKTEITSGP